MFKMVDNDIAKIGNLSGRDSWTGRSVFDVSTFWVISHIIMGEEFWYHAERGDKKLVLSGQFGPKAAEFPIPYRLMFKELENFRNHSLYTLWNVIYLKADFKNFKIFETDDKRSIEPRYKMRWEKPAILYHILT